MSPRRTLVTGVAAALALSLAGAPAWAKKGDDDDHPGKGRGKGHGHGKGHGKGGKHGGDDHGHRDRPGARDVRVGGYFDDRDRHAVRAYYGDHYGGRKGCPPGLAKKNNGCLPPGQAKKYAVGRPLPAGVVVYAVPQPVLVHLPPAPAGHKYVRVAADILLIAVGSSMVIDAMSDLARM